jgi:N4-gp56 family major capsid protein
MVDYIQSLVTPTGTVNGNSHHYLGNAAQQKFFVLALTRRAVPYLVLFEDAQFTTIPKNSGGFGSLGTISFRKVKALWDSAVDGVGEPASLTEGVAPPSKDLDMTEVTTSLKQYGDWIKVSDLAEDASVDGILVHAAEALGEYEGQKLHRVMLYALDSTTNIWYGDGSVNDETLVTSAMTITAALIRKLVRSAKRLNMARFPDGDYHMILEPGQEYDLQGQADFFDAAKYNGGIAAGGGPNMLTGEIGRGWGVRFKSATELLTGTGAAGAVVYHSFFYGPNGFGMIDLATQAVRKIDPRTNRGIAVYTQPVNRPDKLDPLGQLGFVSCKVAFTGVVFDHNQVMKVLTAASA